VYASSLTHGKFHVLLSFNPMTAVVEGFRWALLGRQGLDLGAMAVSTLATFVVLVASLYYFRRVERSFADVV
jgi:lipopolysaccharide transport system permease protein